MGHILNYIHGICKIFENYKITGRLFITLVECTSDCVYVECRLYNGEINQELVINSPFGITVAYSYVHMHDAG